MARPSRETRESSKPVLISDAFYIRCNSHHPYAAKPGRRWRWLPCWPCIDRDRCASELCSAFHLRTWPTLRLEKQLQRSQGMYCKDKE